MDVDDIALLNIHRSTVEVRNSPVCIVVRLHCLSFAGDGELIRQKLQRNFNSDIVSNTIARVVSSPVRQNLCTLIDYTTTRVRHRCHGVLGDVYMISDVFGEVATYSNALKR
jgi:hypothetical protein